MQWQCCVFLLFTSALVSARDAKWFFTKPTVTQYVSAKQVTSSCVVLEEPLKPCRHLRQLLPSPSLPPPKLLMTAPPVRQGPPALSTSQEEHPYVRSWGSYLGLDQVTVTHTITHRSLAPVAHVTFSVRGCRPSRMPFDLPLCPVNRTTHIATSNHIVPTKAVHFTHEH